jgi:hypothetical protein
MDREERRDQLFRLLRRRYGEAHSQADFTAASLACEAGVSAVWLYALVGEQFRRLRAQLPGPITSAESPVSRLRREIAELQGKLKELNAKYEFRIQENIAGAIRHIELLDGENRMLRERVAALEKQLADGKLVITIEGSDSIT